MNINWSSSLDLPLRHVFLSLGGGSHTQPKADLIGLPVASSEPQMDIERRWKKAITFQPFQWLCLKLWSHSLNLWFHMICVHPLAILIAYSAAKPSWRQVEKMQAEESVFQHFWFVSAICKNNLARREWAEEDLEKKNYVPSSQDVCGRKCHGNANDRYVSFWTGLPAVHQLPLLGSWN